MTQATRTFTCFGGELTARNSNPATDVAVSPTMARFVEAGRQA